MRADQWPRGLDVRLCDLLLALRFGHGLGVSLDWSLDLSWDGVRWMFKVVEVWARKKWD
jgi:hypothetical protein